MRLIKDLVTGPWRRQAAPPGYLIVKGVDQYGAPITERLPLPAIEPAWHLALSCMRYALWDHWRIRYQLWRYGIARF